MSARSSSKADTKTALLEVGMDMMMEKGYTSTGIQEILTALRVPKGSFYHYFESKEIFAIETIRHFDRQYSANLMRVLRNPQETPLQRLRTYCQNGKENLEAHNCRKGCLVGNLSQEMADQSEVLRQELCLVIRKWRDMFAACFDEGQKSGEISSLWSADELAEFFNSGWSGAIMRARTVKNTEPIDIFMDIMFGMLSNQREQSDYKTS